MTNRRRNTGKQQQETTSKYFLRGPGEETKIHGNSATAQKTYSMAAKPSCTPTPQGCTPFDSHNTTPDVADGGAKNSNANEPEVCDQPGAVGPTVTQGTGTASEQRSESSGIQGADTERSHTTSEDCMKNTSTFCVNNVTGTLEKENNDATMCTGDKALEKMEHRIMVALTKLGEKVDNIKKDTEEIRREFELKLHTLETKLDANIEKVNSMETSLNFAYELIEDQKKASAQTANGIRTCQTQTQECQEALANHNKEFMSFKQQMLEQLNDLERRTRSYNIRIVGVPEETVHGQRDHRATVADLIVKNRLVSSPVDQVIKAMEIAHPLGKAVRGKYNLIAKFYARPYRNTIVRAAKQHGRDNWTGCEKITEDLTRIDRDRKTRAFPQMEKAYQEGKKVRFQNGKLVIDGTVVNIEN